MPIDKISSTPNISDEEALKYFLLDIDCLDSLSAWTSYFNLFDVLRISRSEIRHSNVLSWLLNPNENHSLSDEVLRGFIHYYVSSFYDEDDVFEALLMDYHSFIVRREWNNIDILAVSSSEKCVLCIENKIDSGEHDNQLKRYRKTIEENYPGFKQMYIYLSPKGEESSEPDIWCAMSYEDIIQIIDNARKKQTLIPEVTLLIENYIDIIRREIVGDEELSKICLAIYSKHQRALDLIYENRPDRAAEVAEVIRQWAKKKTEEQELFFESDVSNKSSIKFSTEIMSKIMPEAETAVSGFGTHKYYYYEIVNDKGLGIRITLSISSQDMPANLCEISDMINELYNKKNRPNWKWRTPYSTKTKKIDEDVNDEMIFAELDKQFEKIKSFELELEEKLKDKEMI